jgi:hypothetical protein
MGVLAEFIAVIREREAMELMNHARRSNDTLVCGKCSCWLRDRTYCVSRVSQPVTAPILPV